MAAAAIAAVGAGVVSYSPRKPSQRCGSSTRLARLTDVGINVFK